jgi:hypothetical protein
MVAGADTPKARALVIVASFPGSGLPSCAGSDGKTSKFPSASVRTGSGKSANPKNRAGSPDIPAGPRVLVPLVPVSDNGRETVAAEDAIFAA